MGKRRKPRMGKRRKPRPLRPERTENAWYLAAYTMWAASVVFCAVTPWIVRT